MYNGHNGKSSLPKQKSFLKRVWSLPMLEHYYRLMFIVLLINGLVLSYVVSRDNWYVVDKSAIQTFINLVVINLSLCILIRQQYVINLLFWFATRVPTSWPLSIRWHLGKVYHHGGLHSGSAISATFWFITFAIALHYYPLTEEVTSSYKLLLPLSYLILFSLIVIIFMAIPVIRRKFHNAFEKVHRFLGWFVLVLFWVLTLSLSIELHPNEELIQVLFTSYSFWALIFVTVSILLPWFRLRRVPVKIHTPSDHVALLQFNYGVTPFAGSSTTISTNPLMEWHHFANIPAPKQLGFRLAVSRAGDWTGQIIESKPKYLWVKGIPTAGVANIEVLFKRVVYVATGSGIGPCLPHLLANQVETHLVWSTRDPRATFGDDLVDEVLLAQPDSIIWDTAERGKPDMVYLAYSAYKAFDAEAVICIANQKLTREVVYGLESRGIPAFGAIWDS